MSETAVGSALTAGQPGLKVREDEVGSRHCTLQDETATTISEEPGSSHAEPTGRSVVGPNIRPPVTGTPGYWKNHPKSWPVNEIEIDRAYTQTEAIDLKNIPERGDMWLSLFKAFVPAWQDKGQWDHKWLDRHNRGKLCSPSRDDLG